MSANTSPSLQGGFTITELLIIITLIGLLIGPIVGGMFFFYGGVEAGKQQTELQMEAQTLLRSVSNELRVSSGIRNSNTIDGPTRASGGWNTSDENLELIIATPAQDSDDNFIINLDTGTPYLNELVYYVADNTLYERTLAHPDASGNSATTTCSINAASPSCSGSYPADKIISRYFQNMDFTFYDTVNDPTGAPSEARSFLMTVNLERQSFGRTLSANHDIRVTMRNQL